MVQQQSASVETLETITDAFNARDLQRISVWLTRIG